MSHAVSLFTHQFTGRTVRSPSLHREQSVPYQLQTSDKYKVAMPLDWKKGDKVIVSPPKTLDELNARIADDTLEKVDWYLAKKSLN